MKSKNLTNKQNVLPKIAILGTRGIPACWGGIERKCEEIYSRLSEKGFPVLIYTRPNYTNYIHEHFRGIKLKSIKTIQEKHLEPFIHTFFCTIHACFSDADIIHYYAQGPCLFSWIPRLLSPNKKVVFSCCGLDWKRKKWNRFAQFMIKIGEWFSAKATHCRISVSNDIIDYYHETYNSDMWYIPNGTTSAKFFPSSKMLLPFGLEVGKYFVFIGRLVPEKAVEELIQAFKLARNELKDIKLAIVGDTSATDNYVNYLKKLSKNDPGIVFTSYIYGETLAALYSYALCYVTPSHLEGLPNALLEAISYGTPVIASDIKAHIEIVHPPGFDPSPANLWIYETGNIHQLSERLIAISSETSEKRIEIGKSTKKIVCNYYSWDRVAYCHALFYKQWANNKKKINIRRQYAELCK